MDGLHLLYATLGTVAVLLALISRTIRRLPVTETLIALLLGVVLGPELSGLLTIAESVRHPLLLEGSRVLLALSVMTAALRFPASGLREVLRPVALLLVVAMPLAAVVSGAVAALLGIPVALALVVGAALAPTDPVLAASVVSGEPAEQDLPDRLRKVLTVESGANDGLALPLVAIAVAVAGGRGGGVLLLWEVLGAVAVGVGAGVLAGWAVQRATLDRSLAHGPELVLTLLLTVAVLGIARAAVTDGVLAVFVAGLAYNRSVGEGERGPQVDIDDAVNRYAVLPLFVLLGAVLPWQTWLDWGWRAVALVAGVLMVRRLPLVLALTRLLGLRLRDAAFLGWFGPMGVSALFYLAFSVDRGVLDDRVFATGTLVVAASTLVFGITAAPGRVVYRRLAGGRTGS